MSHAAHRTVDAPLYPMFGGFAVLGLTYLVGSTDYLGLSLPLIHDSLDGTGVVAFAFLLKLIFTAVTLGTGYLGGEVTPLFVVGSTLGYILGGLLGVDPILLASIGMVAVFAGASNTPWPAPLWAWNFLAAARALPFSRLRGGLSCLRPSGYLHHPAHWHAQVVGSGCAGR